MINIIWFAMLAIGIGAAIAKGDISIVTKATMDGAEDAVKIAIGLVGIMAFWSGIMKIGEQAGLMQKLAKLLNPLARLLFPDIPKDHAAIGTILLSFSANILGLGNACTPLGIKTMEELQKINANKDQASNSMCTFMAITSSSLTIVPTTIIALRVATGSTHPTAIVGTTIFATLCSTLVAIFVDRLLQNLIK